MTTKVSSHDLMGNTDPRSKSYVFLWLVCKTLPELKKVYIKDNKIGKIWLNNSQWFPTQYNIAKLANSYNHNLFQLDTNLCKE